MNEQDKSSAVFGRFSLKVSIDGKDLGYIGANNDGNCVVAPQAEALGFRMIESETAAAKGAYFEVDGGSHDGRYLGRGKTNDRVDLFHKPGRDTFGISGGHMVCDANQQPVSITNDGDVDLYVKAGLSVLTVTQVAATAATAKKVG